MVQYVFQIPWTCVQPALKIPGPGIGKVPRVLPPPRRSEVLFAEERLLAGQNNTCLSGGPWKEKLWMPQSWQMLHGLLDLLLASWLWFSLWFTPSVSLSLLSATYFLVSQSLSGDQTPKKGAIDPVLSIHPLSLPAMPCPVLWEWGRIVQPAHSGQCVWITCKSCRTTLQRGQVSRNFSSHIPYSTWDLAQGTGSHLLSFIPQCCSNFMEVFFFSSNFMKGCLEKRKSDFPESKT